MTLHLVGVMWRSSWWLGSRRSPTPSRSSSPSRLLRPAQTVHLKSTKDLRKSPLTMDSHMADELVVPLKFPGDSVHFLSLLVLVSVIYNPD
ncbi:hypothetical protein Taro_048967 [Colocasia esculenta]|uniref:Uncharacterized protein n=1 Tax=Colocasia esculenta TaxID=4460 RepID=A0A843X9I4_COLES|nr:hypothetical protein [Colocasia esculenta]